MLALMANLDDGVKPGGIPPIPRRFLAGYAVSGVVAGVLCIAVYLADDSVYALVLAGWALVVTPIVLLRRVRTRRRLFDPARRTDPPTGATIEHPSATGRAVQDSRWTGGADVPTSFGRVNATNPLGVLELRGTTLVFQIRPVRLVKCQMGIEPLIITPSQVATIYPARSLVRTPAIAIRPLHGPPYYFLTALGRLRWYGGPWSWDRASILAAIEAAGFPVEWHERTFSRS
jgi:hypothetical protein